MSKELTVAIGYCKYKHQNRLVSCGSEEAEGVVMRIDKLFIRNEGKVNESFSGVQVSVPFNEAPDQARDNAHAIFDGLMDGLRSSRSTPVPASKVPLALNAARLLYKTASEHPSNESTDITRAIFDAFSAARVSAQRREDYTGAFNACCPPAEKKPDRGIADPPALSWEHQQEGDKSRSPSR